MAHYAFLDENNVVTEVIVGIHENELIEGLDPEIWYGNFRGQVCKQTSYNTCFGVHAGGGVPFRKNFAGIGYTYSEELDAFIPPKLYPSWELDYKTFEWKPPVPKPEEEEGYYWHWNEPSQEWEKKTLD